MIALGANVKGRFGGPCRTLKEAAEWLNDGPVRLLALSRVWKSAPFGPVAQPAYFNAVAATQTSLPAAELVKYLAVLERRAGRRRGRPWGARALDLDLLDHDGAVCRPPGMGNRAQGLLAHRWQRRGLVLPHPGMAQRPFVLAPLAQIAPDWRHPVTGRSAAQMLSMLPGKLRALSHPAGNCK